MPQSEMVTLPEGTAGWPHLELTREKEEEKRTRQRWQRGDR